MSITSITISSGIGTKIRKYADDFIHIKLYLMKNFIFKREHGTDSEYKTYKKLSLKVFFRIGSFYPTYVRSVHSPL